MTPGLLLLCMVALVGAYIAFLYYCDRRRALTVRCPHCDAPGEFAAPGPLECHACAHKFAVDLRGRSSTSFTRTVVVPVLLIAIVTSLFFLFDFPQNRSTLWLEIIALLFGSVTYIVIVVHRKKTIPPGTSVREY